MFTSCIFLNKSPNFCTVLNKIYKYFMSHKSLYIYKTLKKKKNNRSAVCIIRLVKESDFSCLKKLLHIFLLNGAIKIHVKKSYINYLYCATCNCTYLFVVHWKMSKLTWQMKVDLGDELLFVSTHIYVNSSLRHCFGRFINFSVSFWTCSFFHTLYIDIFTFDFSN